MRVRAASKTASDVGLSWPWFGPRSNRVLTRCRQDAYARASMSEVSGARAPRRAMVRAGAAVATGAGLFGIRRLAGVARAQEAPPLDESTPLPSAPRPIIVQIDNDPRARPSSNL